MSALGQSPRFDAPPVTSGPPQSTDIIRPAQLVRLVPGSDIWSNNCNLFDDLVGERKQLVRDCQSECLRGLEIDNEIELGRLLDRNFLWARPA
jgi:hypothetical protein